VSAFVVAFLGSVALWWIYFSRRAEAASEIISSPEDPGRLARSAYTYFHIPMIAGIIALAAADELAVAHPGDPGTFASVALILGGNGAGPGRARVLQVCRIRRLPWSHMVAIAVLAVLTPVGFQMPTLALSGAAGLDSGRPYGVGHPSQRRRRALATPVRHVSVRCSPPSHLVQVVIHASA
jgi:low temperature requirement protein LtrA